MSDEEKIAFVQSLIDDVPVDTGGITTYLTVAAQRILDWVYPFGGAPDALPTQYDIIQCELAERMIARRGGEGEISHSENGISRAYATADDEDILRRLTPYVGVV